MFSLEKKAEKMGVGAGDRRVRGGGILGCGGCPRWRVHAKEPQGRSAALSLLSVVLELPRLSRQRRALRAGLGGFLCCGRCLPPTPRPRAGFGPPSMGDSALTPRQPPANPFVRAAGGAPRPCPRVKPPERGGDASPPRLAAGRGVCARGGLGCPNGGGLLWEGGDLLSSCFASLENKEVAWMGLVVAPGLAGLWGARAIGVAPQAPGHGPLLPKRDGGPWFPKGGFNSQCELRVKISPSLFPKPVLLHLGVSWILVSSPGLLHFRWKFLMPVCHTEFKQHATVHVTSIFLNLALFFLKLCPPSPRSSLSLLCRAGLPSLAAAGCGSCAALPATSPVFLQTSREEGWRTGRLCLFL